MNYFKNQRSSQTKPCFPVDHLHESDINNILSQQDKLCHLQPRCSVDSSADDIENKSQQQQYPTAKQDDRLHQIDGRAEDRSNDADAIQGQQQQIFQQRELQQLESSSPSDRFTSAMASVGKSLYGARQLMGLSDEIQLKKDEINTSFKATTFTFTLGQQSCRPVKMVQQEDMQSAAASLKKRKVDVASGYDSNFNLLRCSEQLNPEELELESKQMTTTQSQQSYNAVDVENLPIGNEDYSGNEEEQIDQRSLEHKRRTQKAQKLKLCLNLPSTSSSRTANTARAANNQPFCLEKVNLMKDASSFGNPFNHGIPYQRRQRQIRLQQQRQQAQEPQSLQASSSSRLSTHLLNFPDHLIVSDDNANDYCVSQQNQDQMTLNSNQNIISTMTFQTSQQQSLSQLFKQPSLSTAASSSTAGLQKTRLYLKSQNFSHVMNVRPVFNNKKDSAEQNLTSTSVSKISERLVAEGKQNSVIATSSSIQLSLICKDSKDVSSSAKHQQKVQQYQRRHLLSKRTRVSADQNNIECYDSLITCLKNQSPSECLQRNNNDDSSPQLPSLKRFKSECCNMPAMGVSTRGQEATLISKGAQKVQLQHHNNRLISQASISTVATSTGQNQRHQPPQLQRSTTMLAPPTQQMSSSSMLIENESKEVLLRMFEHLIAREQSHQGLESMKGGRRRDGKGFQCKRGGRSGRLRNINDTNMPPGVLNDEGIKSSSTSMNDTASTATIVLVNGERELRVADNDESAAVDVDRRDPRVEGGDNNRNKEDASAYAVDSCVNENFPPAPPSSQQTALVLEDEQRVTIGQDGVYRLQFRPSSSSGQKATLTQAQAQYQYQHVEEAADVVYQLEQQQTQ